MTDNYARQSESAREESLSDNFFKAEITANETDGVKKEKAFARVHSIQSMGTLDGPGVRFVAFLQGCPLRCACCHNPDTWDFSLGTEYSAEELVAKAVRFKEYFGSDGGVTLSGGEPLMWADFAYEYFSLCKKEGLNTCLDTSGCILNESVKRLLTVSDRVLLDVKYTSDEKYKKYVGCSISAPLKFLSYLNEKGIKTTLRYVVITEKNDTPKEVEELLTIARNNTAVYKIELLPFRKICQVKYDKMGIEFPFACVPEPTREKMAFLSEIVGDYL